MSAAAHDKQAADLRSVLEVTRAMVATEDLDALLSLIMQRSMELLDAERATVFLYDAQTNELISRVAAGVEELRIPADRGICGQAVSTGKTINVHDAYANESFNPDVDRQTGFKTRNILSVPLHNYEGGLVGVLQVLNKRTGPFDDHDISLAETLGAQAGVALQRAWLIEHYLEKQQMQRAMMIARDIQRDLMPEAAPACEAFDIAGFNEPADETGGDIYDFFRLPDGRCMLVVADATGHGIGPALVIAETRAMLRAISVHDTDISEILQHVNNLLIADLGEGRFVTCFYGVLDEDQGKLAYASAGHGPVLFYRRESDRFEQLPATGLPLGIMEEADFESTESHTFDSGDFAVVTTDGFFEAVNSAGEQFGVDRMLHVLRDARDLPADQMIRQLHQAVDAFTAGEPQGDDLTAVIVRKR